MSVIRCGFVKLLSQFERNLSVFEGTQCLNNNFIPLVADDNCGFGNIAYLPSGKANTCAERIRQTLQTNQKCCKKSCMHAQKNQTLHVQRSIKILVLTQGFHVLIKILAVHQFPGCTKCINHIDNLKNVEIKHEVNLYNYRVHKVPYVSALRRLQSPE